MIPYWCHLVNEQDKMFKWLWTGHGSRCQVHRFVSRTITLLGFSCSTDSRVYQEWCTAQRTISLKQLWKALASTWASIPVERFGHLVDSMPQRIEAVLRSIGRVQLKIRVVFLMFCTLSVYYVIKLYGTRSRVMSWTQSEINAVVWSDAIACALVKPAKSYHAWIGILPIS